MTEDRIETFYERCERLAKENKMNMKQLGEKVGVTGASITGWKNGSIPRADVALNIAQVFSVSLEYLLIGEQAESMVLRKDEENLLSVYNQIPEQYRGVAEAQLKALIPLKDLYK